MLYDTLLELNDWDKRNKNLRMQKQSSEKHKRTKKKRKEKCWVLRCYEFESCSECVFV